MGLASMDIKVGLKMRKTDLDEQILRASKEIVVKFIETGRISPTGFAEAFRAILRAVDETVKQTAAQEPAGIPVGEAPGRTPPRQNRP